MPRVSEAVDDRTPLTASRVDVAARVGWLLRTSRSAARLSLRQMSAALRDHGAAVSAATLSRVETEGQRSAPALDGYARVLGLPEGALRAPVDVVCRTLRYAAPASVPSVRRSLDDFSRAFEAVDVPTPTGGAWLELARQHAAGDGYGLPRTSMRPLVHRLATELIRSVGTARWTRHEALALLLCSEYGDLVGDVVRPIVTDPATQGYWDLMDVLSLRPTPATLTWAGELLQDPSLYRVRGASYAVQNMLVVGGLSLEDWFGVVPHLESARRAAGSDPDRRSVLAQLCAALPAPLHDRVAPASAEWDMAAPTPTSWSPNRRGPAYALADSLAQAACARVGHPQEPLLARLLFEAMFDPRGVRMSNATLLLSASAFAPSLVEVLLAERPRLADPATRAAATRVAAFCHAGGDVPGVEALLASADAADFEHGLSFAGRGRRPLPQEVVDRGLVADEVTAHRTLHCLGMTGDRRLERLERDVSLAQQIRLGARWWRAHGPRVTA